MPRKKRLRPPSPENVDAGVQAILEDSGLVWMGIKHYSPACAIHVRRLIEERPFAAVLIEGPDDANELIPWLVHEDTVPPVTILSSWVDKSNKLGKNGEWSVSKDVPARYRGWWPFVVHGPEYAAVVTAAEREVPTYFIDASLKAQLPTLHSVEQRPSDRGLAENRFFAELATRTGHPTFDAFWDATFEAGAFRTSTEAFRKAVLTFAWCARHVSGAGDDPNNALREAHMRSWIDKLRKTHPDGDLLILTGAYHSVALPFLKGKRAPGKPDAQSKTLLCAHSYRALARLAPGSPNPGFGEAVFRAARNHAASPHQEAVLEVLVRAVDDLRQRGLPLGTADAVGALQVAQGLAHLREQAAPTARDAADAATSAFVKGDVRTAGPEVMHALRRALRGSALGQVAEGAGQPPLLQDFYLQAKAHRLDVTGTERMVRCDIHKQVKHQEKSAFLHRCRVLDIPCFGGIPDTDGPFKGPDWVSGDDLHLTTETWAFAWTEEVDDRLVELSDRGPSIREAAAAMLYEELRSAGTDVAAVADVVASIAQVQTTDLLPVALEALLAAAASDDAFEHLVRALEQTGALAGYLSALRRNIEETRIAEASDALYTRSCLTLPSVRNVPDEEATTFVTRIQSLVRIGVTPGPDGSPRDRALLLDRLAEVATTEGAQPMVRGAAQGLLHTFGALSERQVVASLQAYLNGPTESVLSGGAFLEGLLRVARSTIVTSERLLAAVNETLQRLDEDAFRRVLPDFRRAFSVFIPAEIADLGVRVAGLVDPVPHEVLVFPESERQWAAEMDATIHERFETWISSCGTPGAG
ncbi:MAG: DUF5682 family protein [Myxococcota bacterium]